MPNVVVRKSDVGPATKLYLATADEFTKEAILKNYILNEASQRIQSTSVMMAPFEINEVTKLLYIHFDKLKEPCDIKSVNENMLEARGSVSNQYKFFLPAKINYIFQFQTVHKGANNRPIVIVEYEKLLNEMLVLKPGDISTHQCALDVRYNPIKNIFFQTSIEPTRLIRNYFINLRDLYKRERRFSETHRLSESLNKLD